MIDFISSNMDGSLCIDASDPICVDSSQTVLTNFIL